MSRIQLIVAIGEDHQRTDGGNAASEELDQIQCRFVGPMDVLKDHNRRSLPLAEPAQEERKQMVPVAIRLERGEKCALHMQRDIAQRPERSRCEQRVARTP